MEHSSPHPPGLPAPDRAHWTPARQRTFLTALVETGSVVGAARAAGMSRASAHRLRQRLAGTTFDAMWAQALKVHAARLADPFGTDAAASSARERTAPVASPVRR